jgi:hypothetical protein
MAARVEKDDLEYVLEWFHVSIGAPERGVPCESVGEEDGRSLSLHFVIDPDTLMIGKWHEITSLQNGSRSRSEPGLHPAAGELGSSKDRIGAIDHGLTMLRAKRGEVNQDKTAYLGLGGQLSN